MNLLFIAPVGMATSQGKFEAVHGGYGNAAFNTLKILHLLKNEEKINNLSVIDTSAKSIPEKIIKSLLPAYDICISVVNPQSLINNNSFYNLIKNYSSRAKRRYVQIVWETENLPNDFKKIFRDDLFTGFLAPSIWGCKQLKKYTEKPVFYYPHFVDSNNFDLVNIDKKKKEKKFTVLYLGQYTTRKGVNDALISFLRSFSDKEDCELIIKISKLSEKELDPTIQFKSIINLNVSKDVKCKIKFIDDSISNENLGALYDSSSVLLFPSRGEGFGLPVAEAMLQGLPIVYTDWSALHEVAESKYNLPIKYSVDEAYSMSPYGYQKGARYAIPYMYDLMEKLDFLYREWSYNKEEYYKKYQTNRIEIESRYGSRAVKKTILNILNDENHFYIEKDKFTGYSNKTEYLELKKTAEVAQDKDGFQWIIRQNSLNGNILQDEIAANINHEIDLYYKILELDAKDIFIDVGAHVGYYSIRMSEHFNKVLAIEPNLNNFEGLCINTILNGKDGVTNVSCINGLLYSEVKELYLCHDGSSSFIVEDKNNIDKSKKHYVTKSETFDSVFIDIIENYKCVIKIDVEGSELEVLKGAQDSLWQKDNYWVIEYHDRNDTRDKIIEYMKIFEYKIKEELIENKKIIFEK